MTSTIKDGPAPLFPEAPKNAESVSLSMSPISPEALCSAEWQRAMLSSREERGEIIGSMVHQEQMSATNSDDILQLHPYGHTSGWSDYQTLKVAGDANFEVPVKPEVKKFWDALARIKQDSYIDTYNTLLPDHRNKTIEYFQAGGKEQKDEKALLKGTINYMALMRLFERGHEWLVEYSKTGKMPKELPSNFQDSMNRALAGFPGAEKFIDKNAIIEMEIQMKAMYQEYFNEKDAKTADANAKTADANAKTADANAKTADANAKTEQKRKEIGNLIEKFKKM